MVLRSVIPLLVAHQGMASESLEYPFDESLALEYAYLSTAAYCSYPHLKSNDDLEKWACGPACDAVPGFTDAFAVNGARDQDAFVFGGKLRGKCHLVFRGTSDLPGWMQDLKSLKFVDLTDNLVGKSPVKCTYKGKSCKVGDGFMANYNTLAPHVVGNLTRIGCDASEPITVIGHSLGAAEAAISMYDLKNQGYSVVRSYTFGQPRVGDETFAKAFEAEFASTDLWRVTHSSDPVVHLPLSLNGLWRHTPREVFYAGDVNKSYKVCDGSGEDKSCSNSRSTAGVVAAGLTCVATPSKCDHLTYMYATKTILMDGSSCAKQDMII